MTSWKISSDIYLEIEATGSNVVRTSATQYTVSIKATWKPYYSGNQYMWGVTATSGGVTSTLNSFGTKSDGDTKTFTGTYSISGNGSTTKTITVTFRFFNTDTGASYSKNLSLSVNVPAWTSYTISYNANGGSGAPGKQTKWKNQTLTLSSTKPTRTGYSFKNWNTVSNGTGTTYSSGASYTANAAATLYAQWTANGYDVIYNKNTTDTVTNMPSNQTKTHGVNLTLSGNKPVRSGYNFKGWATSASATTASYQPSATYSTNAKLNLYAVWEVAYTKPRISNVQIHRATMKSNGGFAHDDKGTMLVLDFDWATDISNPRYTVEWKKSGDSDWDENNQESYQLTGTNGAKVIYYTDPNIIFSLETSYDVRLTVIDSSGSTTVETVLPSMIMALDVCPAQITYLHIETTSTGSSDNRIYYDANKFSHTSSTEYAISFSARSSTDNTVLVTCVAGSQNVTEHTLSTDWEIYNYTYTAASTGSLTVYIKTANADADIMNIKIVKTGDAYSRLADDATSNTSYWIKESTSSHTISVKTDIEGVGVAIGKTAETHGLFDVDLTSRFRRHVNIGGKTGYHDGNTGIFLSSEGFMHLQRSSAKGYHPYIGFYVDDSTSTAGQIRYNVSSRQLEFLNATGYKFGDHVYISNDDSIMGLDTDGTAYSALMPVTASGNTSLGYGLYNAKKGNTHIYGNKVQFYTNEGIFTNSNDITMNHATTVYGKNSSGTAKNVFEAQNSSNNTILGYGNWSTKSGNTDIMGYDINFGVSNIATPGTFRPYRRRGDSLTITIRTAGYVTNSKADVSFMVPFSAPIVGTPTVTVTSGSGFTLRQGDKYTHGSAADKTVTPTSYSVDRFMWNGIIITAKFSNTTNVTNNDTIGVYWNGTITFS